MPLCIRVFSLFCLFLLSHFLSSKNRSLNFVAILPLAKITLSSSVLKSVAYGTNQSQRLFLFQNQFDWNPDTYNKHVFPSAAIPDLLPNTLEVNALRGFVVRGGGTWIIHLKQRPPLGDNLPCNIAPHNNTTCSISYDHFLVVWIAISIAQVLIWTHVK